MTKKDLPWSNKLPDGRFDDIVIGSGMGGMTAAALLAKMGRRVLVLEQHYVPGGFTHTFKRPHYEWDVGVHAVGEVTEKSVTGRLLTQLTDGRLRWTSLGEVYDEFYYPDDFRIDFPDTPDKFRANLVEAFPREEAAIDEYLRLVREVSGSMKSYYLSRTLPRIPLVGGLVDATLARKAEKSFSQRTEDVVRGLTANDHLRTVLTAQWGYYGSVTRRSSFAMQALVTKHFQWGGYYPEGGSGSIARELLRTVANAGGWTTIRADVETVLIEGGRATGVRLKSGQEVRARRIFSAAGVRATVDRLLPPAAVDAQWARSIRRLRPAAAHLCLYLGFKGDIRQAGAGAANKWFFETWDRDVEGWPVHPGRVEDDCPILYCSFPSLKDPHHDPGPDQRHTGEVVTFVPWHEFEPWLGTRWHRRPEAYEAFKKELEARLLAHFLRRMPGLEPMLDHVELSTPLSTDHFVRPSAGSIYGLEPTPERFANPWLRPRSPVPGLFFANSEVATVGVIGAMMGGVLAVAAAEPRRAMGLLRGGT